ncbi:alpha-amylase family glycosyl hydrolase [Catenovulum sediminis]|uniref:alpha-amylase family glycosyl hydrolase n=1 Tax=Catenovulum sediminis TaxID=1740262 RepID=UPI0033146FBD
MLAVLLLAQSNVNFANPANSVAHADDDQEISIKRDKKTDWWLSARMYHIWIRSFMDSDGDGNGDFKGIEQKIGYLQDLGINTILLSPFFQSVSYHGYDVVDLYQINPTYGNEADFRALIQAAHSRNIKVLLDIPLNHTSQDHPWFKKSLKKKGKYTDYYRWVDTLPNDYGLPWDEHSPVTATWHHKEEREGYYYGLFGYGNPDLNYLNKDVKKEIKKILAYWLGKGVDGFRIDAARHLAEEGNNPLQADTKSNFKLLKSLVSHVKKINPDAFLIGETFSDLVSSKEYLKGKNSLDAVFNFEFFTELRTIYGSGADYFAQGDDTAKRIVEDIYTRIIKHKQLNKEAFVFLNNHDVNRFLINNPQEAVIRRIIATIAILSPFNTTIYYGEEVGVAQTQFDDHMYARAPMQWTSEKNAGFTTNDTTWVDNPAWFPWKAGHTVWFDSFQKQSGNRNVSFQDSDEGSLLNHYKTLLQLKKDDAVLSMPSKFRLVKTSNKHVFAIEYRAGKERRCLLVNLNPYIEQTTLLSSRIKKKYELSKRKLKLAPGEFQILTRTMDRK